MSDWRRKDFYLLTSFSTTRTVSSFPICAPCIFCCMNILTAVSVVQAPMTSWGRMSPSSFDHGMLIYLYGS